MTQKQFNAIEALRRQFAAMREEIDAMKEELAQCAKKPGRKPNQEQQDGAQAAE